MQPWRLALFLLLALTPAFAVEPIDLTFSVPIIAIVVVIFLSLTSMLASAISDPRLEAWVKTEIRELVAGVLLIVVIVAFFIGSAGISIAISGQESYIGASVDILDKWIGSYDYAFQDIIRAATRIRSGATFSPFISIPLWYVSLSYSSNPLGGLSIMLTPLNLAAQALSNVVFIAEGLRMLVIFLSITVPKILLPLSFCLRLIPFTRRIGNTMIAISIAGLVFLPFSIILADNLNGTIDVPNPDIGSTDLELLDPGSWAMLIFEPLCESKTIRSILSLTDPLFAIIVCIPVLVWPPAYPGCVEITWNVVYPIIMEVIVLVGAVLLLVWETAFTVAGWAWAQAIYDVIEPFLADVNNLVLLSYLDFILISIVTIAGARSLSTALGGEWYMAGIQRLI